MTQNYKWYRLLTFEEIASNSLYETLCLYGLKGYDCRKFSSYLVEEWDKNKTYEVRYESYVKWWNAHFGTKLHKHLAGVGNAD